jgi:hypothetical protein
MSRPLRLTIGLVVLLTAIASSAAAAHHNPRLFTNAKGDHGGTFDRGRRTFFWFPKEKRFNYLKVCVWKHPDGEHNCRRFKVRRVPAASYRPWGIDVRTDRYFEIGRGAWDLRFRHLGRNLSPVLGFHRG